MTAAPLLSVRGLEVSFQTPQGVVRAVNGVSFDVFAGERIGLAGESGSGKSVTGLAIMGLVRSPPARVAGEIRFRDVDLQRLRPRERRRVRGAEIAMVFQNPLGSLNPVMTVGDQIVEAIRAHENVARRVARARATELLASVGIPSPAQNVDEFPHRFSGGMRQRVVIALALACEPALVIADEPTTALDVTIQAQIVELLASLCEERGTAVILITHNLGLLAGFADRVVVMYGGRVMEEAPVDEIYYRSAHPYTWGLMSSLTRLDEERRQRLVPIPGNPPSALSLPSGCVFHPRCPHAAAICRSEAPALIGNGHRTACHFTGKLSR